MKKGEEAGEGGKRGGLRDISCHLQIPRCYGTLPWTSREGRTGTRPYQKLGQNQNSSSFPKGSDQIPASRTEEIGKKGRTEKVKGRKERGKEREVNKVSCSLLVGALWPVVHTRRRPGTKGSQLSPLGLVHWQASCPLSIPSGHDINHGKEESLPESPLVAGRGPHPGPETGLLSNTQK